MQLYQFDIKRKIKFEYRINISWKNKVDKTFQNLKKKTETFILQLIIVITRTIINKDIINQIYY